MCRTDCGPGRHVGKDRYYMDQYDSPMGKITLASDGENLKGLWIEGQKVDEKMLKEAAKAAELPVFIEAKRWLDDYFAGKAPGALPPMAPEGTAFQKRVWEILPEIPYGEVYTYGGIARRIAKETGKAKMSAQAVGQAVGRNPISILIPCHRVVGTDGRLVGYGGGLDKKIFLLSLEGWPGLRQEKTDTEF